MKLASEQLGLEPTTRSPLELNDADPNKGVAAATKQLTDRNLPVSDENVFIVATCKDKGIAFLEGNAELGVRKVDPDTESPAEPSPEGAPSQYTVTVNGKDYFLAFEGNNVTVDGSVYQVEFSQRSVGPAAATKAPSAETTAVNAQMPGVVLRTLVNPGDRVDSGDSLLILEAMKMEVAVSAPCAGVVQEVLVAQGRTRRQRSAVGEHRIKRINPDDASPDHRGRIQ